MRRGENTSVAEIKQAKEFAKWKDMEKIYNSTYRCRNFTLVTAFKGLLMNVGLVPELQHQYLTGISLSLFLPVASGAQLCYSGLGL